MTCLVLWPVFAVLFVLADAVVEVLFGAAWAGSAPLFPDPRAGRRRTGTRHGHSVGVPRDRPGHTTDDLGAGQPTRPRRSVRRRSSLGPAAVALAVAASAFLLIVPGFLVAARVPGLRLGDLFGPLLAPGTVAVVAGATAWAATLVVAGPGLLVLAGSSAAIVAAVLVAVVLPPVRRELSAVIHAVRAARPAGAPA